MVFPIARLSSRLLPKRLHRAFLSALSGVMRLGRRSLHGGHDLVLLVIVTVGMTMLETARTPVLEEAVCRHHGRSRDCRDKAVQARLAILNGWIENVSAVQGLLLTMPYAWLAEVIDNRKLLLAGFISSTVSVVYFFGICRLPVGVLPLELVVCFRVLESIGGGTTVAYILLYSSLARKNPVESRTLVIYIAGAVLLLARAAAMVLVGLLLQRSPPSIGPITILVYLTNIPVLLSRPSSRPAMAMGQGQSSCGDAADAYGRVADVSSVTTGLDPDGTGGDDDAPPRKGILLHIKHVLLTAYNEYLGRAVLRTGLFVCAIKIVALDVQFIQPQWSVKKFDWNFTATSYVNAYATLTCMVVLVCLPFLSASLSDRLGSPQRTDILIFRLSLFFRIAGTVAMGLAPTKLSFLAAVGLQALSAGAYDTFKSLVTSFSSAAHVTELYAVISLIETLAHMLSSQLWANLLVLSLGLDRSSMGLPFWVSGFLSLLALATFQVMVGQATELLAPRCIES